MVRGILEELEGAKLVQLEDSDESPQHEASFFSKVLIFLYIYNENGYARYYRTSLDERREVSACSSFANITKRRSMPFSELFCIE